MVLAQATSRLPRSTLEASIQAPSPVRPQRTKPCLPNPIILTANRLPTAAVSTTAISATAVSATTAIPSPTAVPSPGRLLPADELKQQQQQQQHRGRERRAAAVRPRPKCDPDR